MAVIGTPKQVDFYEKVTFYPPKTDTFNSYSLIEKLIGEIQAKYPGVKRISRKEFLDYLNKHFTPYYPHIEKVICYDLANLKLENLNPPPVAKFECGHHLRTRNDLWKNTEKFYSETGWYPYVTGTNQVGKDFALSQKIERALQHHAQDNIRKIGGLGKMGSLRIATLSNPRTLASESDAIGNSCVVHTDTADIILDAGIPRKRMNIDNLREKKHKLVFITHPHDDHDQAFLHFLKNKETFVLASYVTLEFLLRKYLPGDSYRELLINGFFERFVPLTFDDGIAFADGSSVTVIPTEHHPGSVGFILRFADGKELFYSGDVNFESKFIKEPTIKRLEGRKFDYSIIEGSQIGHEWRGMHDDRDEAFLAEIRDSMDADENNIIITNARDHGVQLFLKLYPRLIDKRGMKQFRPVFVDEEIIRQIWTVEYWLQRGEKRATENLDRDIVGSFGKSYLTRSVRVYSYGASNSENFTALKELDWNAALILDEYRLVHEKAYLSEEVLKVLRSKKIKVTVLTKRELGKAVRQHFAEIFGEDNIKEIRGNSWHLHTPAEVLKRTVCEKANVFGQVYIFHTGNDKIKHLNEELAEMGYLGKVRFLPNNPWE